MPEDITGYGGEKIGEVVDYHDDPGKYLGTAFVGTEEKGCLELILWLLLPTVITILEVTQHG